MRHDHGFCHQQVGGPRTAHTVDAIGGQSERTENAILHQVERAGGVSASNWTLASRLEPDFQHPPGELAFEVTRTLRAPAATGRVQ